MKKIAVIALAVLAACFAFGCNESEPIPVITGVKENITVYADDPSNVILEAILDGVTAEGGKPTEIITAVLIKGTDTEATELSAGEYDVRYTAADKRVEAVVCSLTVKPADTTAPEFSGIKDLTVNLGDTVSYRDGVTVTDNDDENVTFTVDASKVDLTRLGKYEVTYTATDKRGNTATVTATVTVLEGLEGDESPVCTKEELDALCRSILDSILTDDMTEREKANAIYNRVYKIKYVSTDEGHDWIGRAYKGLTTNKGDCVNYWAASKALLTMAGIPNYDVERVGGTSEHFWSLACIDGKWYHFDACPTSRNYPFKCFLKTDSEVKAYSDSRTDKPNYYNYDKENCPYDVVE